uniref:Fibroblast growth factor (acidic) intracellular binding protein b n=1 Tax=Cyprinus carpio TaxID=7962 RepID=A0A8C1J699_CYPCA
IFINIIYYIHNITILFIYFYKISLNYIIIPTPTESPSKVANQLLFQIPHHHQAMLIERYYESDSVFAREVLSKKLSKGTKKDLDDISSKTGIFDNFKRVFEVVEELKGPLVVNIQHHFLLSDVLARDYAAIVFFANSRFETRKRKLVSSSATGLWEQLVRYNVMEDMDVDLEKEFLDDLKDLKVLVNDKDMLDQHKSLVCAQLRGKIKVFSEMEANFKVRSMNVFNCKHFSYFFFNYNIFIQQRHLKLIKSFIEPSLSSLHYSSSVHMLEAFRHQVIWDRYMGVIKSCILKMYHD